MRFSYFGAAMQHTSHYGQMRAKTGNIHDSNGSNTSSSSDEPWGHESSPRFKCTSLLFPALSTVVVCFMQSYIIRQDGTSISNRR